MYWRDYPSFIKSFKETCKIDQGKYLINGSGSPHYQQGISTELTMNQTAKMGNSLCCRFKGCAMLKLLLNEYSVCACVCVCASVSKAQMELMSWPAYLNGEVPCVFAWLSSCLRGQEVPPFPYLPGICERTKLIVLVNL